MHSSEIPCLRALRLIENSLQHSLENWKHPSFQEIFSQDIAQVAGQNHFLLTLKGQAGLPNTKRYTGIERISRS